MTQVLMQIGKTQQKVQHSFLLHGALIHAAAGQEMNCRFRPQAELVQRRRVYELAIPALPCHLFQAAECQFEEVFHTQEFRAKRGRHCLSASSYSAREFRAHRKNTPLHTIPLF